MKNVSFAIKSFQPLIVGASVKYVLGFEDENGLYCEKDGSEKTTLPIHPDLASYFSGLLTEILNEIFDNADYRFAFMQGEPKVRPGSVKFSGKGNNRAIQISGVIEVAHGIVVSFKTDRVKYAMKDGELFGRIEAFALGLEKEVEAYILENKAGSVEVFGDE